MDFTQCLAVKDSDLHGEVVLNWDKINKPDTTKKSFHPRSYTIVSGLIMTLALLTVDVHNWQSLLGCIFAVITSVTIFYLSRSQNEGDVLNYGASLNFNKFRYTNPEGAGDIPDIFVRACYGDMVEVRALLSK